MEIKVGGIYKVKNDVFAEDAVLKKATMVKVLRIDAFCFTQMAMVSEFTEKEIKENITSVIWYIRSENLEEAENVEKAKNLASEGLVLKDAILEEQENLLAKAMEQEVSKRVAEIQRDAREDLEKDKNIIRKIADHYGVDIQQLKLIEECGELIVAVAKGEDKNIIEELADVSIMLEQVVYLMDCKKKFKMAKAMKINRQLGRMEGKE